MWTVHLFLSSTDTLNAITGAYQMFINCCNAVRDITSDFSVPVLWVSPENQDFEGLHNHAFHIQV